uniref:Uncharacterized protein n=1 Tax=Curvibacter symbiont subsp. Hydra magnipapillata TaxID=667019 RepID=C9YFF6_CURXX|nr:hypothetical protein Csp_D33120 [Curvibacter putative symbiont of Hydra magnipapillata]
MAVFLWRFRFRVAPQIVGIDEGFGLRQSCCCHKVKGKTTKAQNGK